MAKQAQFPLGPDILVSDILFRTIAGAFGGLFGSAIILVGLLLSSSIAGNALIAETGGVNPLLIFITIVVIYLAILVSALSSASFFYFTNREKYKYLLSTLSHSFAIVTLIFLAATPLTILLSFNNFNTIGIIGLIELGAATVFVSIVQESIAGSRHIMLTIYSSTIALFFFLLLSLLIFLAVQTTTFIVILAFPICWASFGFWQVSLEMSYQWMYSLYGNDFLNKETRVGSDYIKSARK